MWSKVGSATRPQSKERKMWAAHLRMRTPVAYPTNGPGYRAPKFLQGCAELVELGEGNTH